MPQNTAPYFVKRLFMGGAFDLVPFSLFYIEHRNTFYEIEMGFFFKKSL